MHYLVLGDVLVYYIAQALSTRFGSESQTALADGGYLFKQLFAEIIYTKRGQREIYIFLIGIIREGGEQLFYLSVIAGGKRGEGHLLVTRLLAKALGLFLDSVDIFFAERAINKARLTKTAAAYTAAQYLYHRSVMHDGSKRHNEAIGVIDLIEVLYNSLFDTRGDGIGIRLYLADSAVLVIGNIVKLRNVNAIYFSRFAQKFKFCGVRGLHFFVQLKQLYVYLLALAENEHIKEISHRFGIADAWPAADNYRGKVGTVFRKHWQTRQIEHSKNVGIRKLILKREADEIKIADRV